MSGRLGRRRAGVAALALVAATGASGCVGGPARGSSGSGEVVVLAASSLTDVLADLARRFEAEHPDTDLTVAFGASSALAQQVVAGAPADVFVSAAPGPMQVVVDAGAADDPVDVATNSLAIAVPRGNPRRVRGIADLADPRHVVALCAAQVPCGRAARAVLDRARVTASVDTFEPDARAALTKVRLGEVDAALVYRTDVAAGGADVDGVALPPALVRVGTTTYQAAALTHGGGEPSDTARRFVDFLTSDAARAAFDAAGFGRP